MPEKKQVRVVRWGWLSWTLWLWGFFVFAALVVLVGVLSALFVNLNNFRNEYNKNTYIEDTVEDCDVLNYLLGLQSLETYYYGYVNSTFALARYTNVTNPEGDLFNGTNVYNNLAFAYTQETARSALLAANLVVLKATLPAHAAASCTPNVACTYTSVTLANIFAGFSLLQTVTTVVENAYVGSLNEITDPSLLQFVGGIGSAEAENAAYLRTLLGTDPSPNLYISGTNSNQALCALKSYVTNFATCAPFLYATGC